MVVVASLIVLPNYPFIDAFVQFYACRSASSDELSLPVARIVMSQVSECTKLHLVLLIQYAICIVSSFLPKRYLGKIKKN